MTTAKRILTVGAMVLGIALMAQGTASALIPKIDGIQEAGVENGHATASVVDLPDLLTVGKSEANGEGQAKVTVLSLAGRDLLTKDEVGNDGDLAPVGDLADQINEAACADAETRCILVAYSDAEDGEAEFYALHVFPGVGSESISVGHSSASAGCIFTAQAFVVNGEGALEPLSSLNPGGGVAEDGAAC